MPTVRDRQTAVAANAVIANIMTGSEYERLPAPARVRVACVCDQGDAEIDVTLGNTIVAQGASIPLEPAAGVGPRLPEELLVEEAGDVNDLIIVRIRNGAAIAVFRTLVLIDFL